SAFKILALTADGADGKGHILKALTAATGSDAELSTTLGATVIAAGESEAFDVAVDTSAVGSFAAAWDVTAGDSSLIFGATSTLLEDAIVATAVVTFAGDASLDFAVGTADLAILAANFDRSVAGWEQGDFNADGVVDTADLALLAVNFGAGAGPAVGSAAVVPEPATAIGVVGLAGWLWRRRRGV
ncbi:MAG: PEP-CTERM sorting domain-containing protein, partial [Planctomycetota bacterium]